MKTVSFRLFGVLGAAAALSVACGSAADSATATADATGGTNFRECVDYGNEGAPPEGSPTLYEIERNAFGPWLKPIQPIVSQGQPVFRLIIEDVRFTTYKCWDKDKKLTGFDIENAANAVSAAGYRFVEFVPVLWKDVMVDGQKRLSLLAELNAGKADAVTAGMSITPERLEYVDMVGPIYKAGKKLMARNDNPKIATAKLAQLVNVPSGGYEALRGLSVMVSSADIRGAYFRKLKETHPDLVEYLKANPEGTGLLPIENEADKLVVYEGAEWDTINAFIDSHMRAPVLGRTFDVVMLDTGSTKSFIDEGKLGVDTQIVTGNLAADPVLGPVFGTGDGISFRKNDTLKRDRFQGIIAEQIRSGLIDRLVTKWFQDDNAADHAWASRP